eukprot:CAMPEP_0184726676 /NCGR_PEP_ID=MMETSP0314-20130426/34369_1 /TAXON_ID=38298 /ORGANISM="Rhodella maculata, Strain CCMP 736" /LENGTH=480 /DNA_ID=CAMNT_0027192147 /DNA_START=11 /DNA_END=1451 /DNA_ORIENTATION=-
MSVLLETSVGPVVIDLFFHSAPLASRNFLKLCKLKYYNHSQFFSITKNFTATAGDPTNTGSGGRSVYGICYGAQADLFEDEFQNSRLRHKARGLVSMVNKGPDSNGSQFFVTLGEELEYLDGKHTLFGRIAEGRDEFVAALNEAFVDDKGKPYKVLRIRHATILHDPFDDPKGMPSPPASPPPPEDDDVRIGDWEEIPEDTEIREEELKKKDAKSRAEVLEMIGDLPDADVKPPDHVLFICKLNKVTRSSDLDLIFSRFGECQADIIKDQKTGDSLCYGFIEFETKKACEDAYFKMNNCLIDDRRIKVDFSQSVSKLWNDFRRGKGGRPQFVDKPAAYQNPSKAGGSGMVFDTPMLRREALAEDDAYLRKKRGGRVPRDAEEAARTLTVILAVILANSVIEARMIDLATLDEATAKTTARDTTATTTATESTSERRENLDLREVVARSISEKIDLIIVRNTSEPEEIVLLTECALKFEAA